jgi:hypothetical protein
VTAGDFARAKTGYQAVMAACNSCHAASGHQFLRIVEPKAPPVVNRDWGAPPAAPR